MAATDKMQVAFDMNLDQIKGLDKIQSKLKSMRVFDAGNGQKFNNPIDIIRFLRSYGLSQSRSVTEATKAYARLSTSEDKERARSLSTIEKVGLVKAGALIDDQIRKAEAELVSVNKTAASYNNVKNLYERFLGATGEERDVLGRVVNKKASALLYGEKQITSAQQKKLEEIAANTKPIKKQPEELRKSIGQAMFFKTLDAVSSAKEGNIFKTAASGIISSIGAASGPIGAAIATILKVVSLGVKSKYDKAAKTFQNVTKYGSIYSGSVAEAMAGARSGFTEEHYAKLADMSSTFAGDVAFGDISERQWTGLAFLPNYHSALMAGASPEELVSALAMDRALAPNESYFRKYLQMAGVPDEVRSYNALSDSIKSSHKNSYLYSVERRNRALAAKKTQGSIADDSFWAGTSSDWNLLEIMTGDWIRNPGHHLNAFRAITGVDRAAPLWAESLEKQAREASALTGGYGNRPIVVNTEVNIDGTNIYSGTQTQKEAINNNYMFTGGTL